MQIVIEIPKNMLDWVNDPNKFNSEYGLYDFIELVRNGTPLPKGHDRLIEANSVDKIVKSIEPSDAEWGMTAETAIRLIHDAFDRAPTIIPATKEGDGE